MHTMTRSLLCVVLTLASVSAKELEHCRDCVGVLEKAYILSEKAGKSGFSVKDLCENIDGKATQDYCTELMKVDVNYDHMIKDQTPVPDMCIAAKQCQGGLIPPPASPVQFHGAGTEEISSAVRAKTKQIRDDAKLQVQNMQDIVRDMRPNINIAAPPPSPSGSGLAWDKHDFEVTNNKGGDVQVEVNLAAPMSGGDSGSGELEDLAPLLATLATPDEPDMMDMMKMIMNQTHQYEAIQYPDNTAQIQSLLKGVLDAVKDVVNRQQPPPAPPAQQLDIPMIIESMHPPPQPVQPPIDISSIMREMRNAIEAGKQAPPPPPGIDPQLMDLLKSTMQDLRDLHKEAIQQQPPQPPQQPPATTPSPPTTAPLPPPPPPPPATTAKDIQDQLAAAIKQIQANPPPPLPLPSFPAVDKQIDELRALLAKQQQTATKPIILPPPALAPQSDTKVVAPPPPPPAAVQNVHDQILEMLKEHNVRPQRIPAPPVIQRVAQPPAPCCAPPSPDDTRSDDLRCPKLGGVALPRCKRSKPPVLPIRCRRRRCDRDGDVDVDPSDAGLPPCGDDECGDNKSNFNPKALLARLCADGSCGNTMKHSANKALVGS